MAKRLKKKVLRDVNEIAAHIVEQSTGVLPPKNAQNNQIATAAGRLGGWKGGKARAEKLTPEQRKEIGRKAAQVRWSR